MVDKEYIRKALEDSLPIIEINEFVPEDVTRLMYGGDPEVLRLLFRSQVGVKGRSYGPRLNFKLELKCPECGALFTIEVNKTNMLKIFTREWNQCYVISEDEAPMRNTVRECCGQEYEAKEAYVGCTVLKGGKLAAEVIYGGGPYCLACDEKHRKSLIEQISKKAEEHRRQQMQAVLEKDKELRLNDEYCLNVASNYLRPFDPEKDEVNSQEILKLSQAISAMSPNRTKFTQACADWRQSEDVTSTYYFKLMEYEYGHEAGGEIRCTITMRVLGPGERYPLFFSDTEGQEVTNARESVVFVDKALFEKYTYDQITHKVDKILQSRTPGKKGTHTLDDVIDFGRHRGETFRKVLKHNPSYIRWMYDNLDEFELVDNLGNLIEP